jgi:hypothetical protein
VNNLDLENAIHQESPDTEEILGARNNKMYVGGMSCELAKAFDCINHALLLLKLNFLWNLKCSCSVV